MLKSFKTKLALIIIGAAIIPLLLSSLFFLTRVKSIFFSLQKQQVLKTKEYVEKSLQEFETKSLNYAGVLKDFPDIGEATKLAVTSGERSQLLSVLKKYYNPAEMDTLQVIDAKGKVIVRADAPDMYGDTKNEKGIVGIALKGEVNFGIESGARGYAMRAVAPLKNNGEIVGVIMLGRFLNDKFARHFSQDTNSQIIFFLKDNVTGSSISYNDVAGKNKEKINAALKGVISNKKPVILKIKNETYAFSAITYFFRNTWVSLDVVIGVSDREMAKFQNGMILAVIVLFILASVGALALGILLARDLTRPLTSLSQAAHILAKSLVTRNADLTKRLPVKNEDEVGKVTEAFNKVIEAMHIMVSQVRIAADKVSSSSEQVSSSSEEMSSSAQEIATAVQRVNKGAILQAKRFNETFQLLENTTKGLKEVASDAQSASKGVSQAAKSAEVGKVAAQEAVEKINNLVSAIESTNNVIITLGEKSQEIGEITEAITSIADQTNLLALNAAIEAARAGEAGRGFAVVAEEVRKLAEASAEAVRKIGGHIRTIQLETSRAVGSIEMSENQVLEGKELILKIAQLLEQIVKAVNEANALTKNIDNQTQKQFNSAQQIVQTTIEVANISKGSVSDSQQVASTTQEQTALMEEMAGYSQEMARLANELKEMVGQFKL